MEEFRKIPILSRQDVQKHANKIISLSLPKTHLPRGSGRSSGSTGKPIGFHYTRVTGLFYRALNLRFHLWHKNDFSGTVAAIRKPRLKNNDGVRGSAASWLSGYKTGPIRRADPGASGRRTTPVADRGTAELPGHLSDQPAGPDRSCEQVGDCAAPPGGHRHDRRGVYRRGSRDRARPPGA